MSELDSFKRYTITSALPYANGPLHIGHLAGAYIPADIFVRHLRLKKKDVVYICGSDEHGAAITIRAKKEGITPQEIIDKYHTQIKESFAEFGISFDIYHRTSSPVHHDLSQEFFLNLYEKGEFLEKESEQYYDADFDQFLADRYITGTCPNCGHDAAYGDQCEKCGSSLSPTDLVNPKSTLSGKAPVLRTTKHWYLPLDKYQPWLEEWLLEGKKNKWKTNVYGQCSSWLKAGLQPRSMTRDLDWGIDVPLAEAKGKKLYVWLDAPIGYISATKQWAENVGRDWQKYWKKQENEEDNSCLIHFIGKDNIVFHCITFPSILHAHGEYILPQNVPANEFLNLEGDKLSTSRNHAVWLHEYLNEFPGKQDELRYVLTSILPETSDSEFTWKDYQARINNELVAIAGNFVNRVMILMHKYYDGQVSGITTFSDQELQDLIGKQYDEVEEHIETYKFRQALASLMEVARLGNRYLTEKEPWKTFKTDPEATRVVLEDCLLIIAHFGVLSQPFLPAASGKIFAMLGLSQDVFSYDQEIRFETGHQLGKPELLFEKVEDDVIEAQLLKLADKAQSVADAAAVEVAAVAPAKENVNYEQFSAMDIRVGTILTAEKVAKTKKLLKLTIDTGIDTRTVVSGIAECFQPEAIVGKQVSILVNLEPREIKGIMSQGMILMSENSDGKLNFVAPFESTANGSTIR
jgi:methionyl-tRNA synthetase